MHTSVKYAATHGKTNQRLCKALTMQSTSRIGDILPTEIAGLRGGAYCDRRLERQKCLQALQDLRVESCALHNTRVR